MSRIKHTVRFTHICRWAIAGLLAALILAGICATVADETKNGSWSMVIYLLWVGMPYVLMLLWLVGLRRRWVVWLALAGFVSILGAIAILIWAEKAQEPTPIELAFLGSLAFLSPILGAAVYSVGKEAMFPELPDDQSRNQ